MNSDAKIKIHSRFSKYNIHHNNILLNNDMLLKYNFGLLDFFRCPALLSQEKVRSAAWRTGSVTARILITSKSALSLVTALLLLDLRFGNFVG